ncbi:GNAT family N-acetyltransferase [Planomicrobium sp. CPCC 101079]|uniref:GNAT family N-acetyltransferase n=1 Tax=Planomicrobium sp. CPCC 101079 TaxID=2599618 RepID=UPI0011B37D38|nr:GNAT family N-acetyltransferase [Planomicrobium sp. CPCC 101079]TWT02461.1 GNAT family N-acetyltransferase [Planomicrobium sp. CPCC 101079]
MAIRYESAVPEKKAFFALFATTGWNAKYSFTADDLATAISNSYFMVCAYSGEKLVGTGRIISDGVYQTLIGDMIVHPDFQKQGIGSEILTTLLAKCQEDGMKQVQLASAKGKMEFYKKFGFEARPADAPGMQKYL